jgi:hypothetical protein
LYVLRGGAPLPTLSPVARAEVLHALNALTDDAIGAVKVQ